MPALEKLARIEKLGRFLKPGITRAALRREATSISDKAAAGRLSYYNDGLAF